MLAPILIPRINIAVLSTRYYVIISIGLEITFSLAKSSDPADVVEDPRYVQEHSDHVSRRAVVGLVKSGIEGHERWPP